LYFFRGLFVAAVVNGQPISRLEVVRQTEQQNGKQTLDTLVRNALIEQKAKEQNVSVTDKEIEDEIKKLQDNLSKQGQNLDQVLTAQGLSKDDLNKLIRLDKLVAKMVGKDVKVSDEEVAQYIEQNSEALPQGVGEAELRTQVTEQLKQQKTNEKVRTWLADLQKEAKINYFVTY
jgi:foldase protein PrsA